MLDLKEGPGLLDSRLPTPSGRGARVHATEATPFRASLYLTAPSKSNDEDDNDNVFQNGSPPR